MLSIENSIALPMTSLNRIPFHMKFVSWMSSKSFAIVNADKSIAAGVQRRGSRPAYKGHLSRIIHSGMGQVPRGLLWNGNS